MRSRFLAPCLGCAIAVALGGLERYGVKIVGEIPAGLPRLGWDNFDPRTLQHGVGKVCTNEPRARVARLLFQGEGHVPGAAAQVENAGIASSQNVMEGARRPTPP